MIEVRGNLQYVNRSGRVRVALLGPRPSGQDEQVAVRGTDGDYVEGKIKVFDAMRRPSITGRIIEVEPDWDTYREAGE